MMTKMEFLGRFEQLLKRRSGSLKGNEKLAEVVDWDSLQMLNFLLLVKTELGIEANHEEVVNAENVSDLLAIVAPALES